jgi:hypothetical protein
VANPYRLAHSWPPPHPVANFREILAVFANVLFMLDRLVFELLLQIDSLVAGLRQAVDGVHHQVEAIQFVQHCHIERGRNGPLFLVTTDMEVSVVGTPVRQAMDQPWVGTYFV